MSVLTMTLHQAQRHSRTGSTHHPTSHPSQHSNLPHHFQLPHTHSRSPTPTFSHSPTLSTTIPAPNSLSESVYTTPEAPRGLKRSRDDETCRNVASSNTSRASWNDASRESGVSRTMKRKMVISSHDQEHMGHITVKLLFDAQKRTMTSTCVTSQCDVTQGVRSMDVDEQLGLLTCADCGDRSGVQRGNQVTRVMECLGCHRPVCGNCSIAVYTQHGDFQGCFDCSRQ